MPGYRYGGSFVPDLRKRAIMLGMALAAGANTGFLAFMVIAQFDACANVVLANGGGKVFEAVLPSESGYLPLIFVRMMLPTVWPRLCLTDDKLQMESDCQHRLHAVKADLPQPYHCWKAQN